MTFWWAARAAPLAVLVTIMWAVPADACDCGPARPPCEAVWRSSAVFAGRVVAITPRQSLGTEGGPEGIEFEVIEHFRGHPSRTVVLSPSGNCPYRFVLGESYFVYAFEYGGSLMASSCSRTRRLRDAAEDIAYARSLTKIIPGAPARIAGRVFFWNPPILQNGAIVGRAEAKPVPHALVTAVGEGVTVYATTNARGAFELTGLPLGKFMLTPELSVGYEGVPRQVEVFDSRGCGTTDLSIKYDGRLTGRVLDHRGNPVKGLLLDLVPIVDRERRRVGRVQGWTGADGTFEMRLVAPGEYVLGLTTVEGFHAPVFPRAFYPGVVDVAAAQPVPVPPAQRVSLGDFVLPGSVTLVAVTGIVVDRAGQPVEGARIGLSDDTEGPNNIGTGMTTGRDGLFFFALPGGYRYAVLAMRERGSGEPPERGRASFRTSSAPPRVTVVLQSSKAH